MPYQEQSSEFTLVEQAMGNPPSWLIYWGITVLIGFLLVCLGISSLVSYPDTLQAKAIIYTNRPPVEIIAPQTTVLTKVCVSDKQIVAQGTPLVILQSTTHWKDALFLDSLLKEQLEFLTKFDLQLGSLNNPYQAVMQAQKGLQQIRSTDISFQKIEFLQKEINQIKALNESIKRQEALFELELKNIQQDYDRAKQLFQSKTISQQELEKSENTFLQNKRHLENMHSSVISNLIRIEQLQTQIIELEKNKSDVVFNQETLVQQQVEQLKTAIETWKEQHILVASIGGQVSMPLDIKDGTTINSGVVLMTIIPNYNKSHQSIAKATLPSSGIGKLEKGQKATVYFENYPVVEYGMLNAEVLDIALVPQEGNYIVTLALPNDWTTNYGITIPKQQNLEATILIQTQEYTVLTRLFAGLMEILRT